MYVETSACHRTLPSANRPPASRQRHHSTSSKTITTDTLQVTLQVLLKLIWNCSSKYST